MSRQDGGFWPEASREHGRLTVGGTPGAVDSERNVAIVVVHGIPGRDGSIARGGPVYAVCVECVYCVWPGGSRRL